MIISYLTLFFIVFSGQTIFYDHSNVRNGSSTQDAGQQFVVSQPLLLELLLELLSAEINGLYRSYIGDIVEGIFLQDK